MVRQANSLIVCQVAQQEGEGTRCSPE